MEPKKEEFLLALKAFAASLGSLLATEQDEWTIRGFLDVFQNVHTLSQDTKLLSKVLELQLFPFLLAFGKEQNYDLELASQQNWYPDLTFVSQRDPQIRFAVDLKTTYRDDKNPAFCNGFTLGSHGAYFADRTCVKNIQYPYADYSGHFCLGIIYSRTELGKYAETKTYQVDEVAAIPAVIKHFTFFAEEKWKIASDKSGSGNTANIGSIQKIEDILNGNGVFAKAGEELFDDYWVNFGKITLPNGKKLSTFAEYLRYRSLPLSLNNHRATKKEAQP